MVSEPGRHESRVEGNTQDKLENSTSEASTGLRTSFHKYVPQVMNSTVSSSIKTFSGHLSRGNLVSSLRMS